MRSAPGASGRRPAHDQVPAACNACPSPQPPSHALLLSNSYARSVSGTWQPRQHVRPEPALCPGIALSDNHMNEIPEAQSATGEPAPVARAVPAAHADGESAARCPLCVPVTLACPMCRRWIRQPRARQPWPERPCRAAVIRATVIRATVGRATVGRATVGPVTMGRATVGRATVGPATVGRERPWGQRP